MLEDVSPVVATLTDELFALEMMIDMMILDDSTSDHLLKKCAVTVGNCRDLVTKLHWPTTTDQGPVLLQ